MIAKVRELLGILHEIDYPKEEPLLRLVAVESETDHLPVTVAPELLDSEYRERVIKEADEAAAFYRSKLEAPWPSDRI